jgi:hypothetical protein
MLSEGIKALFNASGFIASHSRSTLSVLMFGATLMLAACGGTSDGATGGTAIQSPSAGGGTGTGTSILTVTNAFPASGAGSLTVTSSTAAASGNNRQVVIIASGTSTSGGGSLFHRVTVDYDSVTGTVLGVLDQWGTSLATPAASAGCAVVTTVNVPQLCNNTVVVDPVLRQITFSNTALRGSNSFASTLNAIRLSFTAL